MDGLIARLAALDTCAVSDALDKLGLSGAVVGISPLTGPVKIAGRAVTIKLGAPLPGLPKRHLGAGAVMASNPGDVIVVEHRGRTEVSGWGGLLSRGAVRRGVAAVLVDGACRDIDESRMLGLPVFARAAVPVTARGRVAEHSCEEPITFATVAVKPGDLVIADGSGIVFVDAARAEEIVSTAEDIYAREQRMAEAIDAGKAVGEVLSGDYEDMLKRRET
ncbi:RraA family protein [Bradyrhizobium sp. Pear76]|uniref:RraA family protein n=1 Tax=Bradyrhizobium oropedii TaxID=1571201 RepID=UPI001E51471B|nr:RraA family protein [Bradyrhizobium oropedii]MCC8964360.1 RraA family protein [Bradyrhizobium oropedii]